MVILDVDLNNQKQNGYSSPIITKETNNNEITNFNREKGSNEETPIQRFYSGQCIFITGGTGFVGKILIDKLLRTCPNLQKIYLLIRPKKEKNIEKRMEDLFDDPIFECLKTEVPKFSHKIFAVPGDCCVQGLGLSSADRDMLIRDVSIVFHVAATVRFDEKLKLATAINIRSTADIIELCKSMQNLKSVIHVSTAYANCYESKITEEFYNYPVKHDAVLKMIDCLPENIIDDITPRLIQPWPNTYTFTKAIAEDLVREKNKGLPMGIFRPAIVVSTAKEPVPGWIDNLYGPTGIAAGASSGVLRTIHCDPKMNANIVPVDYTVNALIASAWDVAQQTNKRHDDMLIYNFVSNVDAPITWQDFRLINMRYAIQYPLSTTLWHISLSINKYKIIHNISVLFLHLIPALLIDTLYRCSGKKPRLWKTYQKIHKFTNVLSYFCTQNWYFSNENTRNLWKRLDPKDRELYQFSLQGFDWEKYFKNYMKGIRIYLFKDNLSTLEQSKIRRKRLYALHHTLKTLTITLGFWFLWNMFTKFMQT